MELIKDRRTIVLKKCSLTLVGVHPAIIKMEVDPHEFLEVEDVYEIRKANLDLSAGASFCVLLDTTRGYFNTSAEANELLTSREYAKMRIATALVVTSLATRLAANFFMRLKPGAHTRSFSNEKDALNWLATFD